MKKIQNSLLKIGFSAFILMISFSNLPGADLNIGAANIDMTPPLPVSLDGQMRLRVAETVETPLTASIVLLENGDAGNKTSTIWVSLELVVIPDKLRDMIRASVQEALPEIDVNKIIINATHTHTGPSVREGRFILPENVTPVQETLEFLTQRVTEGIQKAWESRAPGSVSWGLGQAKVGENRRAVYEDGSAKMYGKTNSPEFTGLEGYEDHDVNVLFFWSNSDQLIATCINVACPAQEVEGRSAINADFWYPVRAMLREKFSDDLVVLGWIGAAGDQSPHLMYGEAGEERMRKLRNLDRLEELARRIVVVVEDVYQVVEKDRYQDVELIHEVKKLQLPRRMVTPEEVSEAKSAIAEIEADEEKRVTEYRRIVWNQAVLDRYESQQNNSTQVYDAEIHIIRLGDIAICTNPFELFTEFGIRMKSRSEALQTFVVQLAGSGTYLPTVKAMEGGHYSAIVQSNEVGAKAGDILVEETVQEINKLWKDL